MAWGNLSIREPAPRGRAVQAVRSSCWLSACWGARHTHAPIYGTENSLRPMTALLVCTRLHGKPSLIICYCISHTPSKQEVTVEAPQKVCE